MKKVFIGLAALAVVCAVHVFLLFKKGYHPPPKKIMTPSTFKTPAEIGTALALRYWQDLREQNTVVIATDTDMKSGHEIWAAFLQTVMAREVRFDRFFAEKDLPVLGPAVEALEWPAVEGSLGRGEKVLIHLRSTDASVKTVLEKLAAGVVLFQAPLVVRAEDEGRLTACPETEGYKMRESLQLGCNALEVSRRYYRKRLLPTELIAVVEKTEPLKQILYVHEPEAASAK